MIENTQQPMPLRRAKDSRPLQLGFAGVGWIGRHRLNAIASTSLAEIVAIADPVREAADQVASCHRSARVFDSFEDLLKQDMDGLVIATPSALHASQAIAALDLGIPVFCQKPLGRNAEETAAVIAVARRVDRLLGVDLSYRATMGMRLIHQLVQQGELGNITGIEAVFHNAYGPDKPWFYSKKLAGGGCLLDLGIHLIDLALWCLDYPEVLSARGWTHQSGRGEARDHVDDHAAGLVQFQNGASLSLTCSWGSHAGCEADIRIQFYGTAGGAVFRNVGGSFYDFIAERYFPDRTCQVLAGPPDDWGGRAVLEWVHQLSRSRRFNPEVSHLTQVAGVIDSLYQ
jgi:predicted dehydrogenase